MALTKEQKKVQLQELKDNLDKAVSVIFTNYIGLTVAQVSDLRRQLKKSGAEMKVAKKTLMQLAAKEKGLPELHDSMLSGPVACIFSMNDPIAGAQVAFKFGKDNPQVSFLGGIFEGKLLSRTDAMSLANIPSRQILLGIFAGMIQSPLRSFMSICNSPLGGFARSLSELAKKGGVPKTA